MNPFDWKKIRIIGSVGSGKSTLAKKISIKLNLPYYEIDNMVWIRDKGQDIRNSDLERDTLLQNIICSDAWIIEGVHNEDWVFQSIHQAEVIIFLDPTYRTRTYRIIKRFIFQKIGMEQSNYKPTFKIFFKMFSWKCSKIGKPIL